MVYSTAEYSLHDMVCLAGKFLSREDPVSHINISKHFPQNAPLYDNILLDVLGGASEDVPTSTAGECTYDRLVE